jgi:hypothetical protein
MLIRSSAVVDKGLTLVSQRDVTGARLAFIVIDQLKLVLQMNLKSSHLLGRAQVYVYYTTTDTSTYSVE